MSNSLDSDQKCWSGSKWFAMSKLAAQARKELILFISLCDGISQLIWTNPALYTPIDVPQPLSNDLWIILFQKDGA